MLASKGGEVRLGATEPAQSVVRTESWSRRRGIATAVVVILAVTLTLVLSRLDLANELNVVRSELTTANQEVAESEAELDQLQEEARAAAQTIATCRDSAELSGEARKAFGAIQRGLAQDDQGAIAQGLAEVLRIESEWARANAGCLEAAAEGG
jgi:chromosome segregation ATPase